MPIAIWYVIWFLIWGIFNTRFNWKIAKTKKEKYYQTSFFFLLSSIAVYFIFENFLSKSIEPILLGFIITVGLGIFFSDYYPYYKHIKNGKYFLVSLAFDILLQQVMVVAGIKILNQYFGMNYNNLYFGVMFSAGHLPVIFLKWAKLRYFYLVLTFLGGIGFSFLINEIGGVGILISFLLHYSLYIPMFYYLQDERKI
ncbi:MAG: hypothetical protein HYV90_00625 [Candidatus Woesebacteria bacterium]|nr:MAG: hypothetical protein HYV90_00625 [Candidatus Woesebacteria bacterium]